MEGVSSRWATDVRVSLLRDLVIDVDGREHALREGTELSITEVERIVDERGEETEHLAHCEAYVPELQDMRSFSVDMHDIHSHGKRV